MLSIPSQPFEDVGTVDYWHVMLADIADNKCARHVHGSDVDLRVRPSRNTHL